MPIRSMRGDSPCPPARRRAAGVRRRDDLIGLPSTWLLHASRGGPSNRRASARRVRVSVVLVGAERSLGRGSGSRVTVSRGACSSSKARASDGGLGDARFALTEARARDAYRAPTRSGPARCGPPWPSARRASSRSWSCRSAPPSSSTPRWAPLSSCATSIRSPRSGASAPSWRRRCARGSTMGCTSRTRHARCTCTPTRHRPRHVEETTDANLKRPADLIEPWWALERRRLGSREADQT
jgi:hypothetical protein